MKYRYFTPTDISNYYINDILPSTDDIYIGSVTDHLYITESLKSSNLILTEIEHKYKKICDKVIWIELDIETFFNNAFLKNIDDLRLAENIENYTLPPTYTCNIVIFRNNNDDYWDSDVYNEIIEFYET